MNEFKTDKIRRKKDEDKNIFIGENISSIKDESLIVPNLTTTNNVEPIFSSSSPIQKSRYSTNKQLIAKIDNNEK